MSSTSVVAAQLAVAGAAALRRLRRRRRSPRRRRSTRPAAGVPTRAGARCTRAGCSRASRGRPSPSARDGSGRVPTRPPRSPARPARPSRMNHCSEISGSIALARSGARTAPCACRAPACAIRPSCSSASTTAALRLVDGEPGEAPGGLGHAPVLADHGDLLEPVAAADLEVVRVVAGRDLERAGAELRLHVLVGDDRQPPADERQDRRACRRGRR